MTIMAINEEKLHQLLGQAIVDSGAVSFATLVVIGGKLGLYRALAGTEPQTPAGLAAHTGTAERYVREGLNANAANVARPLARRSHAEKHGWYKKCYSFVDDVQIEPSRGPHHGSDRSPHARAADHLIGGAWHAAAGL